MTGPAPESGGTYVEDIIDDETQPSETPEGQTPGTSVVPGESPLPSVQPSPEGQPPAEPPTGAPPAEPSAPAGDKAALPPGGASVDVSQYPAFDFRVAGESLSFPGSIRGADGAFFPNAILPELAHTLSQGVYHDRHWQRELAERERVAGEKVAAAEAKGAMGEAVLAAFTRLREQGPEAMAKWLDDLDRQWPLLLEKANNQILQQQLESAKSGQTEFQEERAALALAPQLEETLWGQVTAICADPRAAGLDPEWFYSRLVSGFLDQIFVEAPQDDPQRGVTKGQVLVNYDVILREAEYEVSLRKQAADAAKRNASVLGKGASVTPPTIAASRGAAPGTERKAPPKFKSQQEYFDWLETPEGKAHWALAGQ